MNDRVTPALAPRIATALSAPLRWIRANRILTAWIVFLGAKQIVTSAILLQRLLAPPNVILAVVGQGLLFLAPVFVLRGRTRVAALLGADLALTFVLVLDLVYFRQFSDLPSVAALRYVGLAAKVDGIVAALLRPVDFVLFLSGPVFLALVRPRRVIAAPAVPARAARLAALLGVTLVVAVALTSKTVRHPVGMRIRVANRLGFAGYHAHDMVTYGAHLLAVRRFDQAAVLRDAVTYFGERPPPGPSPLAGVAQGMNVVVVQWESLQGFAGGLTVDGQAVTPNLDRLAAESIRFDRFFSQIGQGNTADAELAAQCSLVPIRQGAAFYEHAGTRWRCLPELLHRAGYRTVAMHANTPEFWGRRTTYPDIGFQDFLHLQDFPGKKIGMGTSDQDFFPAAVERIAALPEPFYTVLLSLSSHVPFEANPEFAGKLRHGRYAGTTVAHYLDAIHFADDAFGQLVDGLRSRGLLDRTVLVVFGDHWGISRATSNLGDFLGVAQGDAARFFLEERRVPMMIRIPGVAPGRVGRSGGQLDLAPTLARLLAVPASSAPFLGRDLFDPAPRLVPFPSGAVLDDERLYLSGDAGAGVEGCYRLDGATKEPLAACRGIQASAERTLQLGWTLLEADLIAKTGDLLAAPPEQAAANP